MDIYRAHVLVCGGTGCSSSGSAKLIECFEQKIAEFGLEKGWNFRYITDVTDPVAFNLRGEEYTAETEDFIEAIRAGRTEGRNSFESALNTDRIIAAMTADWESSLKKEEK